MTPPARQPHVRNTGDATATGGGIANTGSIENLAIYSHPPARSTYPALIRQIAPTQLLGRDAELAELGTFCTAPAVDVSYRWLQAPMWSGKSALLAWFFLHPPESVRMVSFFVSSYRAGHDTWAGFADVIGEQLAEILGQPVPILTDATRYGSVASMFEEAAALLRERGERLVVVVDGLDEDRSATTCSIAGMLPARPPNGMRVIIASRLVPPLSDDVPAEHPLRSQNSRQSLSKSPHASIMRQSAERDLDRLLADAEGRDLLGILTAANGALSAADLQSLTGFIPRQIHHQLSAVTARSLAAGQAEWQPDVTEYVLGHPEIYRHAEAFLGAERMAGYRQRLHDWADEYGALQWPQQAPEYLLRSYYGMLDDNDDLPRMIACATDMNRHDRMLDVSGGDTAALSEITTLLDRACRGDPISPDTLALLAMHRDILIQRNSGIPAELPAVWALLGFTNRARALVGPITEPKRRTEALTSLAKAMADMGEFDQAEQLAAAISDEYSRANALDHLVAALVASDRPDQAEEIARSAFPEDYRFRAIALLAKAHAVAGCFEQAVMLAEAIPDPYQHAQGLTLVVKQMNRVGDAKEARGIAAKVVEVCRRATEENGEKAVSIFAVEAVAALGDYDLALAMVRDETDDWIRSEGLRAVATATTEAGRLDQAEEIMRQAPKDRWGHNDWTLARVARAAVRLGDWSRAERLIRGLDADPFDHVLTGMVSEIAATGEVRRAEELARSMTTSNGGRYEERLPGAIAAVAEGAARGGALSAAEAVACTIAHPNVQARALTAAAREMARSGRRDDARRLAGLAENRARTVGRSGWADRVLPELARAVGESGHAGQAAELVQKISGREQRADAMRTIVASLAAAGRFDEAKTLAGSVTNTKEHDYRGKVLAPLVQALAAAGNLNEARGLFRHISSLNWQIDPLLALIEAHAGHGDEAHARYLAGLIARDNWEQPWVALAAGLVQRDVDAAIDLTNEINDRYWRAEAAAHLLAVVQDDSEVFLALADAVEQLIEVGSSDTGSTAWIFLDHAEWAARLGQLSGEIPEIIRQGRAIVVVARTMANVGLLDRAATLVRSLGQPQWRQESAAALVVAAANAGNLRFARELAEEFADWLVWAQFSSAAYRSGHLAMATEALSRAESNIEGAPDELRWAALDCIVRTAAVVAPGRIVELAERIRDADRRAAALTAAAAELGDSDISTLVARAFRDGAWTVPLPLLAVRLPDRVPALANAFVAAVRVDPQERDPDEAFAPDPFPLEVRFN